MLDDSVSISSPNAAFDDDDAQINASGAPYIFKCRTIHT